MTDESVLRGVRGAGLTIFGQLIRVLIQLASLVILSRLLSPADFGLMALIMVFVALGELLRDFGMSTIGSQRQDLSYAQASNLFWVNTALGAGGMVTLTASAPALVLLFDEPRLMTIAPAISVILLLNGAATQYQVQLTRAMRFRVTVSRDVISAFAGLAIAISAAQAGLGVWSLIISTIASSTMYLVISVVAARWVPRWPSRNTSSRAIVQDGATFGVSHFLAYLSANADTIVLGIQLNAATLGVYNRAYQLIQIPVSRLMAPLTQVVMSTLNRAAIEGRSPDRVLMGFHSVFGIVMIGSFAVLGATAAWTVPVLLGASWVEAVPLVHAMCFGGMFWTLSAVNYWRIVHRNLGRQNITFNVLVNVTGVLLIVAAGFVSVTAVAWAVSLRLLIAWGLGTLYFTHLEWNSKMYFTEGLRLLLPGVACAVAGRAVFSAIDQGFVSFVAVAIITWTSFVCLIAASPGGRRRLRSDLQAARSLVGNRA